MGSRRKKKHIIHIKFFVHFLDSTFSAHLFAVNTVSPMPACSCKLVISFHEKNLTESGSQNKQSKLSVTSTLE